MAEIEYFLRAPSFPSFAYHAGGLLIHCAGLKTGGVYLFAGQSGSGKSTVVSLSTASRRAMALTT